MSSIPNLAGEQLSLPFGRERETLENLLRKMTGKDVNLVLTDNGTVMISVRGKGAKLYVRVQRMFLEATDEIIGELARFIKKGGGMTPMLRQFIKESCARIEKRPPRTRLSTSGVYHDLLANFGSLNKEYFCGRIRAGITWGTKRAGGAARRRTLGSYSPVSNIIRINPMLDKKRVPSFFVKFIVYHEMLHADMGVEKKNGRRAVHTGEFRRRERLFREYESAMAWEKNWPHR